MSAPIFIPATTSFHPSVTPYISVADYVNAPTAVDVSQLEPGQGDSANLMELANVIRRASSWADGICYQILGSTQDTETASDVFVRRDGTVRVTNRFWPMLELDSFSSGPAPSAMAAVVNTADIWMEGRSVLVVPVAGLTYSSNPNQLPASGPLWPGMKAYCQWTYWNGWLHTQLAASCTAAATSLTLTAELPASAAGKSLSILDGALTEIVTIASSFTGGTTLPLLTGTVNAHTLLPFPNAVMLSALDDKAREAVISLTSCLIKLQGSSADVMETVGDAPSKEALIQGGGLDDYQVAVDQLDAYRADY